MRRRIMVICIIACLAVGVGWQATASAGGDHPGRYGPHGQVITTSSSTTDPGDSLTVNCKNFAPNEKITFTLHSGGAFLGKTYSNRNGSCSIEVTIPSDTTAGVHTIVATGATGDSASTEITVVIKHHKHHDSGNRPWWDIF